MTQPTDPGTDPAAIRACLTPTVAAVFDSEWAFVMDQAKQTLNLDNVHRFLQKWRLMAYAETKDPGSYFRVLARAARTEATGELPPGSISWGEMKKKLGLDR
ncbi:hypothetical protein D5S17_10425 [Pseudonocardiaceae bacterium YIM PH 21723]|nr:hypothetical protein D5S17_10425 [Pseudonocardiaceae bacterium YIM PH 21723]